MSTIRWKLVDRLREMWQANEQVRVTYGYITKLRRNQLGLSKTHNNDAYVIAGGNNHLRIRPFLVRQVRRNNRSLQMNRKGVGISVRKKRYPLQPNDLVRYEQKLSRVKGTFNYGNYVRVISEESEIKNVTTKKVELITYGKGLSFYLSHKVNFN